MPVSSPRRKEALSILSTIRTISPTIPFLPPSSLSSLPSPLLIDARTDPERNLGTIPNALTPSTATPHLDSSRPIVVFCTVGLRSAALARQLRAPGRQIWNYSVLEHVWAGGDLVRDDGEPWTGEVHVYASRYQQVFPENVETRLYGPVEAVGRAVTLVPSVVGLLAEWAGQKLKGQGNKIEAREWTEEDRQNVRQVSERGEK